MNSKPASNVVGTLMGAILILLGIAFLMVRFIVSIFDFDLGHYTWPLFIIVPGVLMFLGAFMLERQAGLPRQSSAAWWPDRRETDDTKSL